jgi:NAD(P)-dependent dehydrogenase (short-subunit alcohol dehydrogenase family)
VSDVTRGFPGLHQGRVAVVTGAGEGIGRAFAERLARDGARVAVADLGTGAETVAAIESGGGEALAVACDVSSEAGVAALREAVESRFGRCDILVNNAGIVHRTAWAELEFDLWRRTMAVNLDAMFLTCKAFTPAMAAAGFGRIVNLSSGSVAEVVSGFSHYSASKMGVIGLTRGLATDLGESGITANCILPGVTKTPRLEAEFGAPEVFDHFADRQAIKRPGLPSDLEGAVSFLASEDAAWVTGQSLVVDGGSVRL